MFPRRELEAKRVHSPVLARELTLKGLLTIVDVFSLSWLEKTTSSKNNQSTHQSIKIIVASLSLQLLSSLALGMRRTNQECLGLLQPTVQHHKYKPLLSRQLISICWSSSTIASDSSIGLGQDPEDPSRALHPIQGAFSTPPMRMPAPMFPLRTPSFLFIILVPGNIIITIIICGKEGI